MREIKFRGWDLDAGKWRIGNLIAKPQPFIVGQMIYSCEEYCNLEFWWPVVSRSLGQFTGLKDKNGKEIYEGDLIRGNIGIYEIRWNSIGTGFFGHSLGSDGESYFLEIKTLALHEVVGNIYENGDLLK